MASFARFTVFDSNNDVEKTWDVTINGDAEEYFPTHEHTKAIAPGTGYTLQVEIFNSANSAESPVAAGTSDSFEVVAEAETRVSVTCLPTNPIELQADTIDSFSIDATAMGEDHYGDPIISSIGGERWYRVVAPAETIELVAQPRTDDSYDTYAMMTVFDSTGTYSPYTTLSTGFSSNESDTPARLAFNTTPEEVYYVGVIPVTKSGEAIGAVEFSYSGGVADDDNEEDDTFTDAQGLSPIPQNQPVSRTLLDTDWIKLDVTDSSAVAVELNVSLTGFDSTGYYDVTTYDSDGNWIEGWGFGGDRNFLMLTPGPGTYYVEFESSRPGFDYEIEWNVVTSIDDDFEENDSFQTASPFPIGDGPQNLSFSQPPDPDWFRFEGVAGSLYVFETSPVNDFELDTELELYDPSETSISYNDDNSSDGALYNYSVLPFIPASSDTYRLLVRERDGAGGEYRLEISQVTPTELVVGNGWTDGLAETRHGEWFTVPVAAGQSYQISIEDAFVTSGSYSAYAIAEVYHPNGSEYMRFSNVYGQPPSVTVPGDESQLLVHVVPFDLSSSYGGDFAIRVDEVAQ